MYTLTAKDKQIIYYIVHYMQNFFESGYKAFFYYKDGNAVECKVKLDVKNFITEIDGDYVNISYFSQVAPVYIEGRYRYNHDRAFPDNVHIVEKSNAEAKRKLPILSFNPYTREVFIYKKLNKVRTRIGIAIFDDFSTYRGKWYSKTILNNHLPYVYELVDK